MSEGIANALYGNLTDLDTYNSEAVEYYANTIVDFAKATGHDGPRVDLATLEYVDRLVEQIRKKSKRGIPHFAIFGEAYFNSPNWLQEINQHSKLYDLYIGHTQYKHPHEIPELTKQYALAKGSGEMQTGIAHPTITHDVHDYNYRDLFKNPKARMAKQFMALFDVNSPGYFLTGYDVSVDNPKDHQLLQNAMFTDIKPAFEYGNHQENHQLSAEMYEAYSTMAPIMRTDSEYYLDTKGDKTIKAMAYYDPTDKQLDYLVMANGEVEQPSKTVTMENPFEAIPASARTA